MRSKKEKGTGRKVLCAFMSLLMVCGTLPLSNGTAVSANADAADGNRGGTDAYVTDTVFSEKNTSSRAASDTSVTAGPEYDPDVSASAGDAAVTGASSESAISQPEDRKENIILQPGNENSASSSSAVSVRNITDNSHFSEIYYDEEGNAVNNMPLKKIWKYLAGFKKEKSSFSYNNREWAYNIAEKAIKKKAGDSFSLSAAFALFASQKGYSPEIVCGKVRSEAGKKLKKHAFVMIDGRYYDVYARMTLKNKNIFKKKNYPFKYIPSRCFMYKTGQYKKGAVSIAGKAYFFAGNGKLKKGSEKIISDSGNKYFIMKSGELYKGYKILGNSLYCFKGKLHAAARNEKFKGIKYGSDCKAVSSLDVILKIYTENILKKITSASQSRSEKLYSVFNYMSSRTNFRYASVYPDFKDKAWAKKYAASMLKDHAGNCYGFACTFSAFASELGYSPKVICGRIHGSRDHAADGYTRHGLVRINGRWYDPEANWAGYCRGIFNRSSYPMTLKSPKSYDFNSQPGSKEPYKASGSGSSSSEKKTDTIVKKNGSYIYYDSKGEKSVGAYLIDRKLYIFDENGKCKTSDLKGYQRLLEEGTDFSEFTDAAGEPVKSIGTGESCYALNGEDCIEYYKHIIVYTFRNGDGNKIIVSVKSRFDSEKNLKKSLSGNTGSADITGVRAAFTHKGSGIQKNKLVRSGGYLYYYNKNGKKVTNTVIKTGSGKYYFSSKGRGFISCGNKKGDRAVAKVIDSVSFSSGMKPEKQLEVCYRYILKTGSYLGIMPPDLSKKWYYSTAYDFASEKEGNCYSYASLIGLTAKALGIKAEIRTGKCDRGNGSYTQHAWVVVSGKYVIDGVFEDNLGNNGKGKLKLFYRTYSEIESSPGYKYK